MHACLLEIHGIQGSAFVTCLGIFCSSHPGCHTALHPPWIPASPGQAALSDPGPVADLDEPGVAAAPSSSCTRVLRVTPGEPCHGQALLWQHQFVLVPVLLQQLLWAAVSSFPCQLFPMVAWLWPAALWAQHFPSLLPATVLLDTQGNTC